MATLSSLQSAVYTYTNRPDLAAETLAAVKNAVRTAHKSGKYWKDLYSATVAGLPTDVATQNISNIYFTRLRAVATVRPTDREDLYFTPVAIDDLVDLDGYVRTNVYYGLGSDIKVRAASPVADYTITYYQWPLFTSTEVTSWIVDEHEDLIALWAASTVLGMIGEQEIKGRMDQLALIAFADLQQDNIEIVGR